MNGSKSLLQSKTVWASVVAILSGVLSWATDNTAAVESLLRSMHASPEVTATVLQAVAALAGVVAIWGRKVATKTLTVLALFLCLSAGPVGCSVGGGRLSPTQEYQLASKTHEAAVSAVTKLSQAGAISIPALVEFAEIRDASEVLLEAWEASLSDPSAPEWNDFERLDRMLDEMLRILAESENRHAEHSRGPCDSGWGALDGWQDLGAFRFGFGGAAGSDDRRATIALSFAA